MRGDARCPLPRGAGAAACPARGARADRGRQGALAHAHRGAARRRQALRPLHRGHGGGHSPGSERRDRGLGRGRTAGRRQRRLG